MSDKPVSVREALADLLAWLDEKPKPLSEAIKDDEPLRKIERARAALSSPDDTAERLAERRVVEAATEARRLRLHHAAIVLGWREGDKAEADHIATRAESALAIAVDARAALAKAAPPKEGT